MVDTAKNNRLNPPLRYKMKNASPNPHVHHDKLGNLLCKYPLTLRSYKAVP